jgi:hypothetical protein
MRRAFACALWATAFWAAPASEASACSCVSGSSCGASERADAVFVGRATSGSSLVRFDVERSFKGVSVGPVEIANGPGTCAVVFEAGERYLVYAYRDETGRLATHMCSRTRPLRDPHTGADLALLELAPGRRAGAGLLTGVVLDATPNLHDRASTLRGLAGVRVTVTPDGGKPPRTASTRADGSYRLTGLPTGRLTVTATLPASFEPASSVAVDMTTASCAEAYISGFVDGRLTGRLLDEQGRPGRGIEVHLAAPERVRALDAWIPVLTAMTDEQGIFAFGRVGPGRYVIGVDLQMPVRPGTLNRRRFLGETRDPTAATIVELAAAEKRELPPFKLVTLPSERTLTILLRASSREAAAATRFFLTGATRQPVDERSGDTTTLRLPFGAVYVLEAVVPPGYRVEPRSVRIDRDAVDRTVEFTVATP